MKIRMDNANIESLGSKVLSCNETIETDVQKLASIFDSINQAWEGSDSLKYVNSLKEKMEPVLKDLTAEINNYGLFLKNVPNAYDILEEEYASKEIEV